MENPSASAGWAGGQGVWGGGAIYPGHDTMSFWNPAGLKTVYDQMYGQGKLAQSKMQGLQDSGLFDSFGGGSSGDYLAQLYGSDPYKWMLEKGSQSFDDWYSPISGKTSALYGDVRNKAMEIANSDNPSGMPVSSYEQNYALGANPVHGQMRAMRENFLNAGAAGGNRSGMAELASLGPAAMGAGALGQAGAMASAKTTQDEQRRAEVNTAARQNALSTWAGVSGAEAGMLNQALGVYGAQQNSAMQAAMSAIMQMLGLQAQQAPKWSMGFGPQGFEFSGSGSF